ncbi:MAG: RNA polymerase sigma factor [Anaerolineae bacterium]
MNTEDPESVDRELVRMSCRGDRGAFEEIYRRYAARIYGTCLRLTRDAGEAENLTQDTFVRAWFGLASFTGQGRLDGWLARVAVNLWRDKLRSSARLQRLQESMSREVEAADLHGQASPEGGRRSGRTLAAIDLERCLAKLPEGARTVFVLHDVEGYKHREIADLLDLATGTVKAQLHRARHLLRNMLEDPRELTHEA